MIFYGMKLPDPTCKTNLITAIKIARRIHQDSVDWHTRNTKVNQWDKYWVQVYDKVIDELEKKDKR